MAGGWLLLFPALTGAVAVSLVWLRSKTLRSSVLPVVLSLPLVLFCDVFGRLLLISSCDGGKCTISLSSSESETMVGSACACDWGVGWDCCDIRVRVRSCSQGYWYSHSHSDHCNQFSPINSGNLTMVRSAHSFFVSFVSIIGMSLSTSIPTSPLSIPVPEAELVPPFNTCTINSWRRRGAAIRGGWSDKGSEGSSSLVIAGIQVPVSCSMWPCFEATDSIHNSPAIPYPIDAAQNTASCRNSKLSKIFSNSRNPDLIDSNLKYDVSLTVDAFVGLEATSCPFTPFLMFFTTSLVGGWRWSEVTGDRWKEDSVTAK